MLFGGRTGHVYRKLDISGRGELAEAL